MLIKGWHGAEEGGEIPWVRDYLIQADMSISSAA